MRARGGLTLVEVLLVVGAIALLAGFLVPQILAALRKGRTAQCADHLRQIGAVILAYAQEHRDRTPAHLRALADDPGYDLPARVLLCPADDRRGQDERLGRRGLPGDDAAPYTRLHEPGSSYMYEFSSNPGANWYNGLQMLTEDDIAYFYRDRAEGSWPAVGTVSWADAKRHQQQFGNLRPEVTAPRGLPAEFGAPFPRDRVPIVRCFHHANWARLGDLEQQRRVQNVGMTGAVFWSTPYWERDINPLIPK